MESLLYTIGGATNLEWIYAVCSVAFLTYINFKK